MGAFHATPLALAKMLQAPTAGCDCGIRIHPRTQILQRGEVIWSNLPLI